MLGGEHEAHVWSSEVMRGSKELHIYPTDPHFRISYYYIAVLALTNVDLKLSAHFGRNAPSGRDGVEEGDFVPYSGHMSVGREYGGSVSASGEWVYFRLAISAQVSSPLLRASLLTAMMVMTFVWVW